MGKIGGTYCFFKQLSPCRGCILQQNGIGIYYEINPSEERPITAFAFKGDVFAGIAEAKINPTKLIFKEGFEVGQVNDKRLVIIWASVLWNIIVINLLKQFADTEIKIIGGEKGPRKLEIDHVKFLSELSIPVMHIDCSWFIECIRDKEYGVSAHIRLQPCGPGHSLLRFVFVRAYLKHGYHRRAKKDLINETC